MNQEIKTKWVAALRSGEYKQGRARLKTHEGNSFCCLGVLCDLHDKEKGIPQSFDSIAGSLPDHVKDWAEVQSDAPTFKDEKGRHRSLTFLNDIDQYSFKRIADFIEEHADEL